MINSNDTYIPRIVDRELEKMLRISGGVLITGPKACGKTTTAKRQANSLVSFQDPNIRLLSETDSLSLFNGEVPILFDEWQDGFGIWDQSRRFIDDKGSNGLVILTGSVNKKGNKLHSGYGRIAELKMYTMSLFESGESNGSISLSELFDNPNSFRSAKSDLSFDDFLYALCRGGWPQLVKQERNDELLEEVDNMYNNLCSRSLSETDNSKYRPQWIDAILKSYARNICTPASKETIYNDAKSYLNRDISIKTFDRYLDALNSLFILDDVDSWNPNIRSKTTMVSNKKRNFIDPSLAISALGLSPKSLKNDTHTLGYFFESLCLRDLRVYISPLNGRLSYFRTRNGLETDAVIHLRDGRYALIECKLSQKDIDQASSNMNEIEKSIVDRDNKTTDSNITYGKPVFKAVLTLGEYAYRREDGVLVIPIGCLKD
ncbi:MAG: DUF4143 domain-containing protein [Coprobacillus sp.]|nr:DUF4143 domain-containing protein [Coprobacillus sp.]